ncbi:PhzF family phenazine biosynthesis protein [Undibacterium sp. CY18W]|uniref:PhzF family phenazine biosynthesis protein n=1 Tax=Undibacterium hunanense TaxID=2762292 RepID=A0ABR6ZQM7_9BURK|nr:PhzF family phenazine biosynthesis protein [Undibacterium hunanense]MBC3918176.1 PhzF family phenazine biosynthesis protein [Undibacterium hunanense]
MQKERHFKQVDVFTSVPFRGNPVAVILDAAGLSDADMQAIARWTNLAETTFVLPATDPAADYRVRIFSPESEFPFAGHPTLGTAHALLEAGLQPKSDGMLTQECGVGLVSVQIRADGSLAFRAPQAELVNLDDRDYPLLARALNIRPVDFPAPAVIASMGISWLVVRLESARQCLDIQTNAQAFLELVEHCGTDGIALYGPNEIDDPTDFEVRAILPEYGQLVEDPVTGSANACIAWVKQAQAIADNHVIHDGNDSAYSVRQGSLLQRNGHVAVNYQDQHPWIGGHSITVINGTINIPA